MSERLTAAAQALGLPEPLVERSARARAAQLGASYEDVLEQWAGGEVAVATAPSEEPAPAEAPADAADQVETGPVEEAVTVAAAPPAPAPPETEVPVAPRGPFRPPVLVGEADNPMAFLTGVVGLFLLVLLVGLVGPSIPQDAPGERSSRLPYTELALAGRDVYLQNGCASCHTQMVRPVVADVGLGAVTLHDTNQVLGTTRFGPDLSNVGARVTADQLEAIVTGLGDHPPHRLGDDDLAALVAYLAESRTLQEETG